MYRKVQMLTLGALLSVAALAAEVSGFPAEQPIVLWPGGAPGALGAETADVPTLTPYFSPEKATGAAVIVCPGGGYQRLAPHEGEPVAQWLNSLGVTAFVLKYRLGPRYGQPAPLLDAQRAVRLVRSRAKEWNIDVERVGILGFSAGGHLASTAGTHYDAGDPGAADPVARQSCKPSLMILIYPVITMREFTHAGSKRNFLGENPTPELVALYSNEEQVNAATPPAFLVHTFADTGVAVENSLQFVAALRKAKVPVELHLYEKGPHGFGLGRSDPVLTTWPARCADWLKIRGFAR
jgi:acetyl esterase/lipase